MEIIKTAGGGFRDYLEIENANDIVIISSVAKKFQIYYRPSLT